MRDPYFSTTRGGESFVAAMQTLEGTAADAALRALAETDKVRAVLEGAGWPTDVLDAAIDAQRIGNTNGWRAPTNFAIKLDRKAKDRYTC